MDANALYKGDVKTYGSTTTIIIDALDENIVPGDSPRTQVHRRNCADLQTTFTNHSNAQVVRIALPSGGTIADWDNEINSVLAGKTEEDLIIWQYHGTAGVTDKQYKW